MPLVAGPLATDNVKCVHRLYREERLHVQRRRRRKGVAVERRPLAEPDRPNQVWSMDFVSDALEHGRRLKCLTIVDDFSKESVDIVVEHGISGQYVTRVLHAIARFRPLPQTLVRVSEPRSDSIKSQVHKASQCSPSISGEPTDRTVATPPDRLKGADGGSCVAPSHEKWPVGLGWVFSATAA